VGVKKIFCSLHSQNCPPQFQNRGAAPGHAYEKKKICGWHNAAWQPRSYNPQDRDLDCMEAAGWVQESLAFLDAAVQLLHVHGVVCWCTVWLSCWNTKSLPETRRIAGSGITSLWRGEAASNKSVRDITRTFCFVTTMKLPRALQIYSTFFVKKCMRLHFSR